MANKSVSDFKTLYKKALLEEVIPFWTKNAPDWENGEMLEYGWDQQFGGIFYFMDYLGKPMQWKLDWD